MTRHELHFRAQVLSAPALVAVLGGAAAYSGHHAADLRDLLARVAVLAAAAVPVAHALFRPVTRVLASGAPGHVPVERLQRLLLYIGMCMFAITPPDCLGRR